MRRHKPCNYRCICFNSKPIAELVQDMIRDNNPPTMGNLKNLYRVGTKCGRCVPFIRKEYTQQKSQP